MIQVEKQLVSLNQDIAGQSIGIPVYRLYDDAAPATQKVYIQSAVHAAEMQGSAVILKLIEQLKSLTLNAEFVLVPNCNPFGRTQRAGEYLQGRFDATTGNNWNRFYYYAPDNAQNFVEQLTTQTGLDITRFSDKDLISSYQAFLRKKITQNIDSDWGVNTAQYLNGTLQLMACDADVVLDLHTGPSSTRHIYSPEFLATSAQAFNIENIISIPVKFAGALDEASFTPWCDLAECLQQLGREFSYRVNAYTVELGSQENICLDQAKHDALGILNYLQSQQLIAGFNAIDNVEVTTTLLKDYKTLFSKHAGMVEYVAKAGDKVTKGQVIARVLNSLEFDNKKAVIDIVSPVSGTVILHYPSAAVQVGTQLYKIAVAD